MLFAILNSLMVLIVNLFFTHILSKKKKSTLTVFLVIFCFTLLLALTVYLFGIKKETTFRIVIIGLIYVFPLKYLYDMSLKKLFTVVLYSWSYTMIVNTIAYGLAHIIGFVDLTLGVFIIQTFLFLVSFVVILKFSMKKFSVVLNKASSNNQYLLLFLGFTIFCTVIIIRYYLSPNTWMFLALIILLSNVAISSYLMMHQIVKSKLSLDTVNRIAYKDMLTGIKNRYSLLEDMDNLIFSHKSFSVLFMDLDNLKDINDSYDHLAGDNYIKQFSVSAKKLLKNFGKIYRFAGDEFVCLITKNIERFELDIFKCNLHDEMLSFSRFNGVSIGFAMYPDDGSCSSDLINLADQAMYQEKRSKCRVNSN